VGGGEDGAEDEEIPEHSEVEEPPPKREPANLGEYMSENSDTIFAIFDTYLGITDSENERAIIAGVKRFMGR
jgi:hypothetical protein